MIIRDHVAGVNLEVSAQTSAGAFEALAEQSELYATRLEATANEAAVDAATLRRAAVQYRKASAALGWVNTSHAVGAAPAASHKNDSDEGEEDDGREDDDFEVGEKG